jgi:cytochrome P450
VTDFDIFAPPAQPWAALDELREQCPVHAAARGAMHVVGFPAVTDSLGDWETFSSRSPRPPSGDEAEQLVHLDGPAHARARRLVNKALPKREMARAQPWVQDIARELLTPHLAQGELDLVPVLSQPLPAIVFFRLLGVSAEDRVRFMQWADEAVSHSYRSEESPSHGEFVSYIRERIAFCRENAGEDVLSALVHAVEGSDRFSDDELVAMVRILIIAGTETTTNAISTMFLHLLAAPELWEKVKADENLRAVAVEETLRIDPPLMWVPRITAAAADVDGVHIPAGCLVAVNLASANHDPSRYADPHAFRLDRSKDEPMMLTFGAGAHFCVGAPLARAELRGVLNVAIELLPDVHLAEGYEFAPRGPVMMRGARTLPVRFTPRSQRFSPRGP